METEQISDELTVAEMSTVQRIANELLCTERTYVKKLYLIDQVKFEFCNLCCNRRKLKKSLVDLIVSAIHLLSWWIDYNG